MLLLPPDIGFVIAAFVILHTSLFTWQPQLKPSFKNPTFPSALLPDMSFTSENFFKKKFCESTVNYSTKVVTPSCLAFCYQGDRALEAFQYSPACPVRCSLPHRLPSQDQASQSLRSIPCPPQRSSQSWRAF